MPASVRYIVTDVEAALGFYTRLLGFAEKLHVPRSFAILLRGELQLMLSTPGGQGGGGQAMPDGRMPEPGGWNRIQIQVDDLISEVDQLREAGVRFRNEIVTGVGARQILVEDPSGNPIELFEKLG